MTYELHTLSPRRFMSVVIASPLILLAVPGFVSDPPILLASVCIWIVLSVIVARKWAAQTTIVKISSEEVNIGEARISFSDIQGFHVNTQGAGIASLELKLNDGSLKSIWAKSNGQDGRRFKEFIKAFRSAQLASETGGTELSYTQLHTNIATLFRILVIAIVVADLALLFLVITDRIQVPLIQLVLMNVPVIGYVSIWWPWKRNRWQEVQ